MTSNGTDFCTGMIGGAGSSAKSDPINLLEHLESATAARQLSASQSLWVRLCVSERISERLSQCLLEQLSQCVSERVSEQLTE